MICPCGKPIPDLAAKHGDLFCSRKCSAEAHGCDTPAPHPGPPVGRIHFQGLSGPAVPVTPLQRCRALVDEWARREL